MERISRRNFMKEGMATILAGTSIAYAEDKKEPEKREYAGEDHYKGPEEVTWHAIKVLDGEGSSWSVKRQPSLEQNEKFKDTYNAKDEEERKLEFKGRAEYIRFENGNILGVILEDEGNIYKFRTDGEYKIFDKKTLDENPKVLSEPQKDLYDLVQTTDALLKELKKIDN